MWNLKKDKIIALVVTGLFLIFSLSLFTQINDLVSLFLLSKFAEESSINSNLVYLYFWLTFVSGVILFVLCLLKSTKKEVVVNEIDVLDNKENEDATKKEKEKLEKEKRKKNAIIDYIIKELDSQLKLEDFSDKLLSNIARQFDIVQGIIFVKNPITSYYKMTGNYAWFWEEIPKEFQEGEGLSGQVAKNRKLIDVKNIPEDYITVISGLGNSSPNHLVIFPLLYDNEPIGVVELASFKPFTDEAKVVLEAVSRIVGGQVNDRLKSMKSSQ